MIKYPTDGKEKKHGATMRTKPKRPAGQYNAFAFQIRW